MRKGLVIAAITAGVVASGASAQPQQLLMPGVTYDREVVYTLEGRVVTHVITAPRPGGRYSLTPILAGGAVRSRMKLTAFERRLSATATTVGVTADTFTARKGPTGIVEQGGVLQGFPNPDRSSLGIGTDGNLVVRQVPFSADWRGTGGLQDLRGLNRPPLRGWVTMYTSQWGSATPRQQGVVEAVLDPFPGAVPGPDLTGTVIRLASGGGQSIPRNGAVLTALGGARAKLRADARPGTVVTVRLRLGGGFGAIPQAIGGGPVLVRNGRAVFNSEEAFDPVELARRMPRAAVGQRADGSILLVSVDGTRPGYSAGATNYELAQTMQRLGAVAAIALSSGRETALAFDGGLLSRPAAGERSVSTALLLSYTGVQAPPPSTPVLSPNGDAVNDVEQVAYKVVRNSTVTATLAGPGGVVLPIATNRQTAPGTYTVDWTGTGGNGRLEPEGDWTWDVTAVDDLGSTSASRGFSLNTTLAKLGAVWQEQAGSSGLLEIGFDLLHPATVTLQVEARSGAILRTLPAKAEPAGDFSLTWGGGLAGHRHIQRGRYQLRATAVNQIGTMDLVAPFQVK